MAAMAALRQRGRLRVVVQGFGTWCGALRSLQQGLENLTDALLLPGWTLYLGSAGRRRPAPSPPLLVCN